ncbi:MAG: extracellular solute-binding protein [Opitutaceae bacterium]|jgi:multiple sugar transport system substrate-binding protein/raffinose/stachyose/melibiose transport system substrate-binding protein|nr:extracellular solute-binding protein [Opitutaceae bacterium]
MAAVGVSFWQVLSRIHGRASGADASSVTLRIGHWLLQEGMRESFDEAARAYEELRPDVRVEQVAVPVRIWPAWVRTQLVGGTAPDILGMNGLNEEYINRYFLPLADAANEPNRWNTGTSLEGLPWGETFVDGLASMLERVPTTGELQSVMLQLNTSRLFYNRQLLRAVTGSDEPPSDYAALRALGGRVADYNARTGRNLVTIASCGPYAEYLFARLLPSQTQKLAIALSPMQTFTLTPAEQARALLGGRIDYATPELRSALALLRDVSTLMPPGFYQLQRDDALFAFLQGNALMIFAGAWDYAVFARNRNFDVGICPLPAPSIDDPDYGRFVLGPRAETEGSPEATFGVVRSSPHSAIAIDFLRFLTSHRMARMFADNTYRTSAIRDVPPPEHAAGLAAVLDGEVPGFRPDFPVTFGGGRASHVFRSNLHRLLGQRGDPDGFVETLNRETPAALRSDMERHARQTLRNVRQLDARIGLLFTRNEAGSAAPDPDWTRVSELRHAGQVEYLLSNRYADLTNP